MRRRVRGGSSRSALPALVARSESMPAPRCQSGGGGSGPVVHEELALQLDKATLDVVQRVVDATQLASDLGGIARVPLLARDGEKLDERADHAADRVEHPPPEGTRALRPPRRLGAHGTLPPQQRALQELQLALLVPQLLHGRLR